MKNKQAPSGDGFKRAKTLGEQIKALQPKDTFKDRNQAMIDAQKAKEEPTLYAVLGNGEKVTDLHSFERAKKIADETRGKIWLMSREGEDITFLALLQ